MKRTLEDIRSVEELVLKTSKACERLGGSNPSSSVTVHLQRIRTSFEGGHQYTKPIDAAEFKAWDATSGNLPLGGSKETNQNTGPRSKPPGPLCISDREKENKPMFAPYAQEPHPECSSESTVSPKLAFEQLVAKAFALREEARRKTADSMVVLNLLATEADETTKKAS